MAAEGATARSGAGEPSEEAGASEQETAAEDPGNKMQQNKCVQRGFVDKTLINYNNTKSDKSAAHEEFLNT